MLPGKLYPGSKGPNRLPQERNGFVVRIHILKHCFPVKIYIVPYGTSIRSYLPFYQYVVPTGQSRRG